MEIGLLIGGNCSKAVEPEEVLPSKDSGPFAFRTPLAWCVVGLLCAYWAKVRKESSSTCSQTVVQDTGSSYRKNSIPSFRYVQ